MSLYSKLTGRPLQAVLALLMAVTIAGATGVNSFAGTKNSRHVARYIGVDAHSHVVIGHHKYRLVRSVKFKTRHFGTVILKKGFVSDGSTSPIADVPGSLYAGFLHDALYDGSPYLKFVSGFPGRWTKRQADEEYCYQLKRLGVNDQHRNINCIGVKLLNPLISPWGFNHSKRKKLWAAYQSKEFPESP
jgi:hypothetical protein